MSEDANQQIAPIPLDIPAGEAMSRLEAIIRTMPRSRIISAQDHYLHVEFRSWLLQFVDDVEFLIDEPTATIHFRASARTGYSDLGINRRRLEEIRQRYKGGAK
jgi:uncharacterized protein (DUF1499 family)